MNRLKYLREEKGLTQPQVAKVVGLSAPAYCLVENEQRRMSRQMIEKLADYFNVSTDYLLGRTIARTPRY